MVRKLLLLPILLLFLTIVSAQQARLYVWAESGLHLRAQPDQKAQSLTILPYGTELEIAPAPQDTESFQIPFEFKNASCDKEFQIRGAYIHVRANGLKGYVFSGYTGKLKPPVQKLPDYFEYFTQQFGKPIYSYTDSSAHPGQSQWYYFPAGAVLNDWTQEGGRVTRYHITLPAFSLNEAFILVNQIENIQCRMEGEGELHHTGVYSFWSSSEYFSEGLVNIFEYRDHIYIDILRDWE